MGLWWNYRVIRTVVHGQSVFSLHRCFYDTKEKKRPVLIETLPANVVGLKALTMLQDIEVMTDAFEQPTLYIPEWNSGV